MVFNISRNMGILINRAIRITALIAGMLLIGCTYNVAVTSFPDLLKTYPDKIKIKALLVIPDSLSHYVYKRSPPLPLDTWVFPIGQPTSDLLRKGVQLVFHETEVSAETPPESDPKNQTFGLILKPSINSFDFGLGSATGGIGPRTADWVMIELKIEVFDPKGKLIFSKTVRGWGEIKVKAFSAEALSPGRKASLGQAADYAVQNGVNLLLESLYESKEIREYGK